MTVYNEVIQKIILTEQRVIDCRGEVKVNVDKLIKDIEDTTDDLKIYHGILANEAKNGGAVVRAIKAIGNLGGLFDIKYVILLEQGSVDEVVQVLDSLYMDDYCILTNLSIGD